MPLPCLSWGGDSPLQSLKRTRSEEVSQGLSRLGLRSHSSPLTLCSATSVTLVFPGTPATLLPQGLCTGCSPLTDVHTAHSVATSEFYFFLPDHTKIVSCIPLTPNANPPYPTFSVLLTSYTTCLKGIRIALCCLTSDMSMSSQG